MSIVEVSNLSVPEVRGKVVAPLPKLECYDLMHFEPLLWYGAGVTIRKQDKRFCYITGCGREEPRPVRTTSQPGGTDAALIIGPKGWIEWLAM